MENTEKTMNPHIHFRENKGNDIALFSVNNKESIENLGVNTHKGIKKRVGELWGKPIIVGDKNLLTENEIWLDEKDNKSISQLIIKKNKNVETNLISNPKIYGTLDYTYDADNNEVTNCIPLPTKIEDVWKNIDINFSCIFGGQRDVSIDSTYQGYTKLGDGENIISLKEGKKYTLEEIFKTFETTIMKNASPSKVFNFIDFHLSNPYIVSTNAFKVSSLTLNNIIYFILNYKTKDTNISIIENTTKTISTFSAMDVYFSSDTSTIKNLYVVFNSGREINNDNYLYPIFYVSPISNTIYMFIIYMEAGNTPYSTEAKVGLVPVYNYDFSLLRNFLGLNDCKVLSTLKTAFVPYMEGYTLNLTPEYILANMIKTEWKLNYMELG